MVKEKEWEREELRWRIFPKRGHIMREKEREGWSFALCLVDFGWERERGERKGGREEESVSC